MSQGPSYFNIIICRNIGLGLFYIFQDYHNTYLLPLDNHLVKKHLFATTLISFEKRPNARTAQKELEKLAPWNEEVQKMFARKMK